MCPLVAPPLSFVGWGVVPDAPGGPGLDSPGFLYFPLPFFRDGGDLWEVSRPLKFWSLCLSSGAQF